MNHLFVLVSSIASTVMFCNTHITDSIWILSSIHCIRPNRVAIAYIWVLYGTLRVIVLCLSFDSCMMTMALHIMSFLGVFRMNTRVMYRG